MEKETKQQRFKRVAEKRVQNILNGIRSLSQCANPRTYAWDNKQLQKIWDVIDHELIQCKENFSDPDARAFRL
jgi:hypothetical protein